MKLNFSFYNLTFPALPLIAYFLCSAAQFDLWNEIKAHIDSLSDLDFIQFVNSINNYKLSSNNLIDDDRQEKNMDNPDNNYSHEVAQEEKKEKLPGLEDGVV